MKQIFNHIYMSIAAALTIATLAACSSDEPSNAGGNGQADNEAESYITFDFGGSYNAPAWEAHTGARGGDPIDSEMPESVGVWAYNDKALGGLSLSGVGEVFRNVECYYKGGTKYKEIEGLDTTWVEGNKWPYLNPMPWIPSTPTQPVNYKFYSYAPYTPTGNGMEVEEMSYAGFKYVTWYNIPRYSNVDYMTASTVTCYTSKPRGQRNTWQRMSLMHLQARLRFCFKLGERFSDLRFIRIKKLEVINLLGQTFNLRIRFDDDGTGYYVPTFQWDRNPSGGDYDSQDLLFDGGAEYIELTKENNTVYTPTASLYVYPREELGAINIRVTYDVYDVTGQLLRENDSAVSNVVLNLKAEGSTGTRVLETGYYYDVNIKVQPTFLYVLSDNDMSADGQIVMNPDLDTNP